LLLIISLKIFSSSIEFGAEIIIARLLLSSILFSILYIISLAILGFKIGFIFSFIKYFKS
jgi:hypothetical protein